MEGGRNIFAVVILVAACVALLATGFNTSLDKRIIPPGLALAAKTAVSRFQEPGVLYTAFPAEADRNGKRVLITGGAGFIGSQLGHHLHKLGYEVILLDNMAFGYDDNLVVDGKRFGRFVRGDVLDERIWRYLEGVDAVFHFAALSALPVCQANPRHATDVNVAGVANILEGCRMHGVRRFLFASTSAVYESNKEPIFTEDLAVNPHLIYSLSKIQAEQLAFAMGETYDQDVVVLRFFNVYGPHQDFRRRSPPFTSYIVRELVNGRAPVLHSDGKQRRDYVYVTDLMDLAIRAMTNPAARNNIFNVASGKAYSVNEMYDIVATELKRSSIRPIYHNASSFWDAYPELRAGVRPLKMSILEKEVNKMVVGSNEKARRVLDWTPKVSMEEGLRQMVSYITRMQTAVGDKKFDTAWHQ